MLPDVADDEIVEFVRTAYGLAVREVASVPGREHAEADVYRVVGDEGAFFLKLRALRSAASSPLARYLVDSGVSHVIAALRTRDGRLTAQLNGRQASLYPFIEGENGFRRPLDEEQWVVLGTALRAVHDVRLPPSIASAMRREDYADRWRAKTRSYLAALASDATGDEVSLELASLLARHTAQIVALVEHAEQLAPDVGGKALAEVPCHGDLHAGNVLIDGAGSLVIVDWDNPVLAPRERDLMFVGAGIGGVWNRDDEAAAFRRGYGPVAIDADALAYYRCERIVEDVAVFCDQILDRGAHNEAARGLMLRRLASAFNPNDVVEIAERTFVAR
jgi:spectinomycin phosphotransferase